MIAKNEIREMITKNYIDAIARSNDNFSEVKIRQVWDVYTHFSIDDSACDEQQVAKVILNPWKETARSYKIGNIIIDYRRALTDIFTIADNISNINVNNQIFKNCRLIFSIITTILHLTGYEFDKQQFYIVYYLYSNSPDGVEEQVLRNVMLDQHQIDATEFDTAVSKLCDTHTVEIINGRIVLKESVVLETYI